MEIRNDKLKGLSYINIAKKYNIDRKNCKKICAKINKKNQSMFLKIKTLRKIKIGYTHTLDDLPPEHLQELEFPKTY